MEASEFLQHYLPQNLAPIAIFCALSAIFLFAPLPKVNPRFAPRILRFAASVLFVLCVLGAGLKHWQISHFAFNEAFFAYLSDKNIFFRYGEALKNTLKNQAHIAQYKELLRDYKAYQDAANYTVTNRENLPTIVLIIGESTQRNHMQLYGYALENTPNLVRLQDSRNLVVFTDTIAPHSHTNLVLEKMLTFKNYENASTPWFEQQNLIDVMRLAGYKTHWISNQELASIYGNAPEVIATRSDVVRLSEIAANSYTVGKLKDEVVLSMFKKLKAQKDFPREERKNFQDSMDSLPPKNLTKNFYVFHLMGTHLGYKARYPAAFARFNAESFRAAGLDSLNKTTKLTPSQAKIKAEYANAIFYNDFVVSGIMEQFKDEDALVFYISDHGDEVYDFRDFVGHTESLGSRFMVEVPFVVYMSDVFKRKHPDIVAKIIAAKDRPFMSDDFIHAFMDILGIESADFEARRSIFNAGFDDKRKRIFNGKNYDQELKVKK